MSTEKHRHSFPELILDTELSTLDPDVLAAINERIAVYRKQFPQGEPMYKKVIPYRVFIYAEDIVLMTNKSLRTAQRVLQNTRILLEKKPNADITITEFCAVNDWNKDETQAFLDKLDESREIDG